MLSKLKPLFATQQTRNEDAEHNGIPSDNVAQAVPESKEAAINGEKDIVGDSNSDNNSSDLKPNHDAQHGVERVEAITLTWTKNSLIAAYVFILLVYFINSLQQQITGNLTPYVVSDFSEHSLIAVIGIVSNLLSGILQLPTAKVLDIWGRSEGFAIMTFIATMGLLLMAVCQNVETYAAAQVFYSVGFTGMSYVLSVVVADTSSMKNRAIAFAFTSSPYIATAFAGPAAAESFLNNSTFRWAFGCFTIITPAISIPIFGLLWWHQRKAKKQGLLAPESSGRTILQSIRFYLIEFDAVGVLLLSGGLVMFLLPFSLAGSEASAWNSSKIIGLIVSGPIVLILFGLWERFVAPTPYLPYNLLASRTVVGACILAATLFIGYFCWDGYYTSYLQVVHGLSVSEAGYVGNIYNVGSCFWAIIVGILIRWSGKFKWLAWCALPVQVLGGGLMIHFRQPDTNIGYVVMCQIFIAFAGGTLVICEQMAVMAVAEHGQVAALLALLSLASSIGAGIGSAVSGAIWTNTLYNQLITHLPSEALDMALDIYGDLDTQLSYPFGDPVRTAIVHAYGVTQQRMCIAGTAVLALAFLGVGLWKDVRVKDVKQVKGMVL